MSKGWKEEARGAESSDSLKRLPLWKKGREAEKQESQTAAQSQEESQQMSAEGNVSGEAR